MTTRKIMDKGKTLRDEIEACFRVHPRYGGEVTDTLEIQVIIDRLASDTAKGQAFLNKQRAFVTGATKAAKPFVCGSITWGSAWEHEQSCNNPDH